MPKRVSDERRNEIIDALRRFESYRESLAWASRYGRELADRITLDPGEDDTPHRAPAIHDRMSDLDRLAGEIEKIIAYAAYNVVIDQDEALDDD